jgi:isopentenyl-diphosphate delta-isomerase
MSAEKHITVNPIPIEDPNAANRKKDHIELALKSQSNITDNRFYYEPVLSAHPAAPLQPIDFLGKKMLAPIWISSMTGGTEIAGIINKNLARACAEFGLGMGLGSTRKLLFSDEYFNDFNLRGIIGNSQPFYANLGIAQVEKLLEEKATDKIEALVAKLQVDGIFLHINPFQEWLQPEGDIIKRPPLETIQYLLEIASYKIIVKEVGQGMGYESLKALFQLPLAAIDFAAHGGTNFSKVELLRNTSAKQQVFNNLVNIGHSAEEMVQMSNAILQELGNKAQCKEVIISGGIQNFLDGYYLINKINTKAVYGQGSSFLQHARGSYEELQEFVKNQIEGLRLANAFLKVK